MADIHRYPLFRHLRADQSSHILRYRNGLLKEEGRGLACWFFPMTASIAEIPVDDRELTFLFHGRSRDFQDVTAQGVITFRAVAPDRLAERIDFTVDLASGRYRKEPFEKLALMLNQLVQQFTWDHFARHDVRQILAMGCDAVRTCISEGLTDDQGLLQMGLQIVSIRVASVAPSSDLDKALETPTRELIQQKADEATFTRRAQAVEKERAIQEAELQNQIELATREEQLIAQRGQNDRKRATEEMEARRIEAEAGASRSRIHAEAKAQSHRLVETARVDSERERMGIYRDLPTSVMLGLAAQELAGKLHTIEHLNITPDMLGPQLLSLLEAGTRHLEEPTGENG